MENDEQIRKAWGNFPSGVTVVTTNTEDGQVYGITMIDHPENPRHPTTWWARNRKDFCLLHPSPCYREPFAVPVGEPLTLQYRIVVHRGHASPDIVEEAGW